VTAVSVTEVRNALRCPRLFTLGRRLGQSVVFPVSASSLGAVFHRIAERFSTSLANPPPAALELELSVGAERVSEVLSSWLARYLVAEIESTPALASMPAEVDDLAESLREPARYLSRRLPSAGPLLPALGRLLRGAEVGVEQVVETQAGPVRLSGRVDAIFAPSDERWEIVEYKLTDEQNSELDRAQVALYRHMLRDAGHASASAVILRFNPVLSETRVEPKEADALVGDRLLPLVQSMAEWAQHPELAPATKRRDLCPACPVRGACTDLHRDALPPRDEPPAGAPRPRPDPKGNVHVPEARVQSSSNPPQAFDEQGEREATELKALIVSILHQQGVNAVVRRPPMVGSRLIQIEVSVQRGRIATVDRAAEDVLHVLASQHDVQATYDHRGPLRAFVVSRKHPRTVQLSPLLESKRAWLAERPGRFVVGETVSGEVLTGDLSDSLSCHVLIGGMAGSGKSSLLKAIVYGMAECHPPSAVTFNLVDPKRVTFGSRTQASLGAHLAHRISYEVEEALSILEELVEEMEERYQRFEATNVEDLGSYNAAVSAGDSLPRRIVVIDEFQDLLSVKDSREAFLSVVQRLGAKARAAGIHLILATQRPDAKTVPGLIKSNMSGKIALRVQSHVDSKIVLDQTGAETLLGKGDLLANLGEGIVRAQAPWVE
jgi:DNA segregation ATPase FtsK/SpoIIIE, S-DNA-T family